MSPPSEVEAEPAVARTYALGLMKGRRPYASLGDGDGAARRPYLGLYRDAPRDLRGGQLPSGLWMV